MSLASQEASHKTEQEGSKSESDDEEIECRICHDTKENEALVSPCECKGTVGLVHLACLQRWLLESARSRCELCGARFELRRALHRTAERSMLVWWCVPRGLTHPRLRLAGRHALRSDLLALGCVALLLSAANCACVMLADFYLMRYSSSEIDVSEPRERSMYSHHLGRGHNGRMTREDRNSPTTVDTREEQSGTYITQVSGFFTAIMLMLLVLVSFSCFVCWAQLALRLQADIWYFWWQHDVTVTVVAEPVDKHAYRRSMHLSRRRGNEGSQLTANLPGPMGAPPMAREEGNDGAARRGSASPTPPPASLFSPASLWARFRRRSGDSDSASPSVPAPTAASTTVAGVRPAQAPEQQPPPPPSGAQVQAQAPANARGSAPVRAPAAGGTAGTNPVPAQQQQQQQQPSRAQPRTQATTNGPSRAPVRTPGAGGSAGTNPAPAQHEQEQPSRTQSRDQATTNASSPAPVRAPATGGTAGTNSAPVQQPQQQPSRTQSRTQTTTNASSQAPVRGPAAGGTAGTNPAPAQQQQQQPSRTQSRAQATTNTYSPEPQRAPTVSSGTAGRHASAQQQPPPSGEQAQATTNVRSPSSLPASTSQGTTSTGDRRGSAQRQQPRSARPQTQTQAPEDNPASPSAGGSGPEAPAYIIWRHSTGS